MIKWKYTTRLCQSAFLFSFLTFLCVNVVADEVDNGNLETNKTVVTIDGQRVEPSFGTVAGSWFYHNGQDSSQLLLFGFPKAGIEQQSNYRLVADVNKDSKVSLEIPLPSQTVQVSCVARALGDTKVKVNWGIPEAGNVPLMESIIGNEEHIIEVKLASKVDTILLTIAADSETNESSAIEITDFKYQTAPSFSTLTLEPKRKVQSLNPIATSPNFRPSLEQALIEWDWQMQDGVGTEREPRSYKQAVELRLAQGEQLLEDLQKTIDESSFESLIAYDENIGENFETFASQLEEYQNKWENLKAQLVKLTDSGVAESDSQFESLWKSVHELKRSILLSSPYFQINSLLFVKHAPGVMSHQLTQVYGYCARPGGGLFMLEQPGKSMKTRDITPSNLPLGSYMNPELSFDAQDIYFSFCDTPDTPKAWRAPEVMDRRYHLFKMPLNGIEAKQLTNGDYDDFAPILLPDNDLIFCSTRRNGFHRCGGGPCYVYTLARCKADGTDSHPISFHETNEWFPVLAHNGRVVYTRWDYVDRDAVYYQQLWSTRQDGTDARIYYGNNTFNPPGMWEPKSVPGSDKIMAVGGPHHGLSAGSVVLLDVTKGVDGTEPVERLTPDVLFPEGEAPLPMIPQVPNLCDFDFVPTGFWHAQRPADRAQETPEERRWPVHCFKSPYPLAEKYFIASYSFDKLLGECGPNIPNQFGIYFCDAFGNRELIYRDPNISSIWAIPVRPRPVPPVVASTLDETRCDPENPTGTFFLQNIYESWPYEIKEKITALRIVQVLPKTTPNANQPMVGAANASPGKQVLGVVPVEEDGSAFFEAPAKIPLLFQALDENGRMVQGMRSLVYLQPGETAGCVGCHEDRMATTPNAKTIASTKQPEKLQPGPDGSKPFSYPILVQPILDQKCVECHNPEKPESKVDLTGVIDGHYTKSYNALVNYVPYTYWGAPEGNHEPRTEPNRFGSRVSKLTSLLENDHYGVKLTDEEWERLNTWQDVNALFYGTFDPAGQEVQQKGGRISGPALE